MTEFKVTKADNISLLFSNKDLHTPYKKQSIIIKKKDILIVKMLIPQKNLSSKSVKTRINMIIEKILVSTE